MVKVELGLGNKTAQFKFVLMMKDDSISVLMNSKIDMDWYPQNRSLSGKSFSLPSHFEKTTKQDLSQSSKFVLFEIIKQIT